MSKLSIKMRVTLFYTFLMLLLVLLVLVFLFALSRSVMENDAKNLLMNVVDNNTEEVEFEFGRLEYDDDDFDFFMDGVYSLVYSDSKTLLWGELPHGVPLDVPFVDNGVQTAVAGEARFSVYDRLIHIEGFGEIWVRGILPLTTEFNMGGSFFQLALVALPILVVIAAFLGYLVTKRAFLPIRQINETANAITDGKNLSTRIAEDGGQDEIHALIQTINKMLERLELAFETEKQFVSDASHELRTPVSVILAQCELALEDDPSMAEDREALLVVKRQADKMAGLIAQLLTITRLDMGTKKAVFEMADVSTLITALCKEQALIAPRGISIQTDIAPNVTAQIDAPLVTMLFENLMSNALKYAKDAGRVDVSLHAQMGRVSLCVKDDGPGIKTEEQNKIWRRFYQVDNARTGTGSVGLGLSIVSQIAYLHKGKMELVSEPGHGSAFTFSFPSSFSK